MKGVSNIIRIDYIKESTKESTAGTLEATVFREIRDLIPFHEF